MTLSEYLKTARKDCGCPDDLHQGPHWLHMDAVYAELNRRILRQAEQCKDPIMGIALFSRFAEEETVRLDFKLREMWSHGIE